MTDSSESAGLQLASAEQFAAALRGDSDAIRQLVAQVAPVISAHVRGAGPLLSRADSDVEDLVQLVLTVIWRRLPIFEFRGVFALRAWVLQLARHVVLDRVKYMRANGRGRIGDWGGRSLEEVVSTETSVPSRVARRERSAELQEALRELPDAQREVVEMHLLEDRSLGEIASWLGISKNAVWERLQRGLLRLRSTLRGSTS